MKRGGREEWEKRGEESAEKEAAKGKEKEVTRTKSRKPVCVFILCLVYDKHNF